MIAKELVLETGGVAKIRNLSSKKQLSIRDKRYYYCQPHTEIAATPAPIF